MDTDAVMNKLRAMLDLRKELLEAAAESPPVPVFEEVLGAPRARPRAECPVSKFKRSHGLDHGNLAKLFAGIGHWSWECPFCGAEFEE